MIVNSKNPRIKSIIKLQQKPSERKNKKSFVIEGRRELSIAQQCGYEICEIYICKDIYKHDYLYPVKMEDQNIIPVSINVYNKIAYRKDSEGIIGVAAIKEKGLPDITLSSTPLILVLEAIEKPGNLGAILRTADAAGIDAVILCNQKTDHFNPNVIRSSLGCIFSNQVLSADSEEIINWLTKNDISIFATLPDSGNLYYEMDFTKPTAIVMGAESEGISKPWASAANHNIKIPMTGKIDSLNVSVSTGIVIYEAIRQRKTKPKKC